MLNFCHHIFRERGTGYESKQFIFPKRFSGALGADRLKTKASHEKQEK